MTATPAVAAPVQALLARAIDFAGLFPPASLDPGIALDEFLSYRRGPDAWALGRFVVSAPLLERLPRHPEPPVDLSVVIGPEIQADLSRIEAFRIPGYQIQALEIKGPPGPDPGPTPVRYFEIPLEDGVDHRLEAVRRAGGLLKVRTGGTTPAAFPDSQALTRFLMAAARVRLPFKATAGLHHPVRGAYRLTYEAGAPSGVMYGYLNLAVAAFLAWIEAPPEEVEAALLESDRAAIRFEVDAIRWRPHRFPTDLIARVRREFFHGFGSCSFREPLDELGLLR